MTVPTTDVFENGLFIIALSFEIKDLEGIFQHKVFKILLSLFAIWATGSRVLTLIYIPLSGTPFNRDIVKHYGADGYPHNAVTAVQ